MKKSCANCKAANHDFGCSLGYKVQRLWMTGEWEGIQKDSKPLVQCPKPLTNKKYIDMSLGHIPGKVGTMHYE